MRQALNIRPVNSLKHIVDVVGTTTLTLINAIDVVSAVDAPIFTTSNLVHVGSVIKWIYLRVEATVSASHTLRPNFYMAVFKSPAGDITISNINTSGVTEERKFIIHQEMRMMGSTGSATFPRTIFAGVIRIPPKYQRFGINDELRVALQNGPGETTGETDWCMQCIYKEFY